MSTSLYDLFDVNEELETKGFILQLIEATAEGEISVSFVLARAGGANKKYTKRVQQLLKPHQHAFDRGKLSPAVQDKIFIRALSEHVVLGWEGIFSREGEPREFSVENCVDLLTDIPELFSTIHKEANDISNFIDVERVESSKNSQPSTSGNSVEENKPTKSKKQQ